MEENESKKKNQSIRRFLPIVTSPILEIMDLPNRAYNDWRIQMPSSIHCKIMQRLLIFLNGTSRRTFFRIPHLYTDSPLNIFDSIYISPLNE